MKTIFIVIIILLLSLRLFSQNEKSNCNISFSYSIFDNQLLHFSHKIIDGSDVIVSYLWDFGDGYTSNEQNPEHVYLNPGMYVTCLTVIFDNNCQSTYCDTLVIRNPILDTLQNYGISGYVYAGNAKLPNGIVVLIKSINNRLYAVDYTTVDTGFYHFNYITQGTYYLYAIPYFNINVLYYPNYFPTYYGDKLFWQEATPILLNGFQMNKNIHLISDYDMVIGDDSLTGTVHIVDSLSFEYNIYLNNWFSSELPPQDNLSFAPNQVLLLLDENNTPKRFSLSNHNGKYCFKYLPKKIFKLHLEKHNLISYDYLCYGSSNVDVFLMNSYVAIGIDENTIQFNTNVYPNPVTDFLYVLFDANIKVIDNLNFELYSIEGKPIYQQNFKNDVSASFVIPMHSCQKGIYLLRISANNIKPVIVRIVKN